MVRGSHPSMLFMLAFIGLTLLVLLASARPTGARVTNAPGQQIMWPTPTFTPTRTITPAGPSSNRIQNPSFSLDSNLDGKPDHWGFDSANANYIFRTSEHWDSPQHSLKLLTKASWGAYSVSQLVTGFNPQQYYWFAAKTNLPQQGVTYKINLRWQTSTGATVGTVRSWTSSTVGGWVSHTGQGIVPANATRALISVEVAGSSLGLVLYADSFLLG